MSGELVFLAYLHFFKHAYIKSLKLADSYKLQPYLSLKPGLLSASTLLGVQSKDCLLRPLVLTESSLTSRPLCEPAHEMA